MPAFFNGRRALKDGLHPAGYSKDHAWDNFKEMNGITDPTSGVGGQGGGCYS